MTSRKLARPVQVLLYVGLALGLVLLLQTVFGGLAGTGERIRVRSRANGRPSVVERLDRAGAAGKQAAQAGQAEEKANVFVKPNEQAPSLLERMPRRENVPWKGTVMNLEFMQRAIALAQENIRQGGGPFAAVIVKDGRVVAECGNSVTRTLDPTAHAEVNAIREACRRLHTYDLRGCDIYASCEPCPMCLAAIYWARLDRLYFAAGREDAARAGFDDDLLYREIPLACEDRSLPTRRVMAEEGKLPFADWARYEEKVPY